MRCMCGHAVKMCIGAAATQVVVVCSCVCGRIAGTDPNADSHAAELAGATSVVSTVAVAVGGGPAPKRRTCACTTRVRVSVGSAMATPAGSVKGSPPGAQTCMTVELGMASHGVRPLG